MLYSDNERMPSKGGNGERKRSAVNIQPSPPPQFKYFEHEFWIPRTPPPPPILFLNKSALEEMFPFTYPNTISEYPGIPLLQFLPLNFFFSFSTTPTPLSSEDQKRHTPPLNLSWYFTNPPTPSRKMLLFSYSRFWIVSSPDQHFLNGFAQMRFCPLHTTNSKNPPISYPLTLNQNIQDMKVFW